MEEEVKFPLGVYPHTYTGKEIQYASMIPHEGIAAAEPLPEAMDRTGVQSPVVLQNFGSCVAFAEKGDEEAMQIEKAGTFTPVSGRGEYGFCKSIDGIPDVSGTYPYFGKKVRMGIGFADDAVYPNVLTPTEKEYSATPPDDVLENAGKRLLSGVVFLTTDYEKKHWLVNKRQFTCTVPVYSDYLSTDDEGVANKPESEVFPKWGYHRVLCVGYDDNKEYKGGKGCWKIKNSWGNGWGEKNDDGTRTGYGWIPYNYGMSDAMGSADEVVASETVGAPPLLAYPVDDPYVITQHFGDNGAYYSQFGLPGHNGLDIRARDGANLYAVDDGQVIWARPKPSTKSGYGNCVVIQHAWGQTLYGHMKDYAVSEGMTVTRKQLIGHSDATGNVIAGAAHLHLGAKINGVKNPAYNDWVSLEPYLKGINVKLPRHGFAKYKGAGAEVYYHQISNWNGALEIAEMFKGADTKNIGKIQNFNSLPDIGYVFGNDGRTVSFYYRIHGPEEKALLVNMLQADPNKIEQLENL